MRDDRSTLKTILLWGSLALLFILVFQYFQQAGTEQEITFSQFVDDARTFTDADKPWSGVQEFTVSDDGVIYGKFTDGSSFRTSGNVEALGDNLLLLLRKGVKIDYGTAGQTEVPEDAQKISFTEFVEKALGAPVAEPDDTSFRRSIVEKVDVRGDQLKLTYRVDPKARFTSGSIDNIESELISYGVAVKREPADENGFWAQFLISWVPMIFLFVIFFLFIRQLQAGGGKAMSFGKSRHKMLQENAKRVTFADIAGIEESKAELSEIVDFLRDPKKYTRLGGRIPRGVLLMGPPGTGKTLLARGVAGEAGVPFFSISGSDFVEMFVGVGASRVRDLFEQGKKNAPCIIFIDEIDAVGRHRGAGLGGGHDEREQTLNQLLVEMDGFEGNEGVILIAATNRPDVLDPALLRPGRFDRRVVIPLPDLPGRLGILRVHTRNKPLAPDTDLGAIAKGTPGFSGADLENLVNEAALLAARRSAKQIERADLDEAKDKVMMGTARKSLAQTFEEKRKTAYHEAGHALVARVTTHADPVYKVTIVPRGMALGLTQLLPEKDKLSYTRSWLVDMMTMLMGGRVAEELVFNELTTGAGQDIQQATEFARKMVAEWGMSRLGPIAFDKRDDEVFLGRDFAKHRTYSESAALRIDREIKHLVMESYEKATEILTTHRAALDDIASELLEKESLTWDDIETIAVKHGLEPRERPSTVAEPPPPSSGFSEQQGQSQVQDSDDVGSSDQNDSASKDEQDDPYPER